MDERLSAFVHVPLYYGTKIPTVRWKSMVERVEALERMMFPAEVKRNVAIIVRNGLTVLDFDDGRLYEEWAEVNPSLACTMTVKSGRGFHAYFYVEDGTFPVMGPVGVDVKVSGLMVVPPSLHASGVRYEFVNDSSILYVPDMEGLGVEWTVRENGGMTVASGSMELSPIERCVEKISLLQEMEKLTQLSRRGDGWIGKCPFHDDNRPSLRVWEDHFFCFAEGCWAHRRRDVVDLVARQNGCGIRDAIDIILGGMNNGQN